MVCAVDKEVPSVVCAVGKEVPSAVAAAVLLSAAVEPGDKVERIRSGVV